MWERKFRSQSELTLQNKHKLSDKVEAKYDLSRIIVVTQINKSTFYKKKDTSESSVGISRLRVRAAGPIRSKKRKYADHCLEAYPIPTIFHAH